MDRTATLEAQPNAMNSGINETDPPQENIVWQPQPTTAPCDHEYEAITALDVQVGERVLRRCIKCGSLEKV